jgi:hypothetical protein
MLDHDGKSKTASAVDEGHYPEINTDAAEQPQDPGHPPTEDEIAERAHQIWLERGCPSGSAVQDWQEAERQLRLAHTSKVQIRTLHDSSGSVQP